MELIKLHNNGLVTIPEVLRKTAQKIKKVGLAKGVRHDRHGRMCVLGAIHAVVIGNAGNISPDESNLVKKTVKALGLRLKPNEHPFSPHAFALADWNNAPLQTQEGVIAGLLKAANLIERQKPE